MIKALIKQCMRTIAGTVGWKVAKTGDKKLIILMYHRILPKHDSRYQYEEPGMVVTDTTFKLHMQFIADEGLPVLTPQQWIEMSHKERPQLAFSITFDDGWLDNYEYAFPVLKEFGFVSTLYVVTDFLGEKAPFWPNRVLRLLLSEQSSISDEWDGLIRLIGKTPTLPMSREEAAGIILALKRYSDGQIYSALKQISEPDNLPVEMISKEQLLDAQDNMGVVVGCHTRRHFRLTESLPKDILTEEIVSSKVIVEEEVGHTPTMFCFPNGDFSSDALQLVKAHYRSAVTTKRGHNCTKAFDPHQLVRIGVHNDISDTTLKFKARLSSWM